MRKRMTSAFVAVTFVLLIGVSVHANDEQIGKQIVGRLQEQRQAAQLEGFNIGVQVENGTVTMSGSVANAAQAGVALDVARRVPGVKLVVNDLRIQTAAPAASQPDAPVAPSTPTPTTAQPVNYTAAAPPIPQAGDGPDHRTGRTASTRAGQRGARGADAPTAGAIRGIDAGRSADGDGSRLAPWVVRQAHPISAMQRPVDSDPSDGCVTTAACFARGNLQSNRPLPAGPGLVRAQYMEEQGGVVHGGQVRTAARCTAVR